MNHFASVCMQKRQSRSPKSKHSKVHKAELEAMEEVQRRFSEDLQEMKALHRLRTTPA